MRNFPVTLDDSLQVSSWNALASVRLTIRGFVRNPEGLWLPFSGEHVPNTDRTINSTLIGLPDGELTNVSVFVSAAAPIIGQTFVRLQIIRGSAAAGTIQATLAAGYVTAVQPLAFPGSGVRRSVDGPGALRSITGTDPAAGVEIAETVPTGARWKLLTMQFTLVTDATVANRNVSVGFDDGATLYGQYNNNVNTTAGLAHVHSAGAAIGFSTTSGSERHISTPVDMVQLAAHRIRTITANLQAGDNYGAPQLLVEEWLEGAA